MTSEQRRLLKEALSAYRVEREALMDADLTVGDERDCELCHDPFVIRRARQRFCCAEHRMTAQRRVEWARKSEASRVRRYEARMRRYHDQKQEAA